MTKQNTALTLLLTMLCMAATMLNAQTARKFTVNITPDGKANMVAYLPDKPDGRAVVGCPGGGYSHLSMESEGHLWANYFNDRGIAYFVLTYRMPKGDRNIPMSDARNAIRTVRDSASAWHINPRNVGIMGFSAGGHLASTISTHTDWAERPDFTILFYPVISMNERESHKGSCTNFLGEEGKKDQQLVKEFSNHNAVRRHLTPPTAILLANDDRAVPPVTNGIAYYTAMRRAGNPCALYVYPTGGHGFGMKKAFDYRQQMLDDLSTWLSQLQLPRADAQRVACMGNSITDGMGIDMASQLGYPAQLQKLLGSGYDVRNFGVSSRTLLNKGDHPYQKEQAWRDALSFKPDVAIIKLGTNDSKTYNWKHAADFESDLQQMIDQLRPMPAPQVKGKKRKQLQPPTHPRIVLCTPIKAQKDIWEISDSVIVNGIIPLIYKVADRNRLEVIDLHTLFVPAVDDMQRDGIHPTDKGARKIAEIIAEKLKP